MQAALEVEGQAALEVEVQAALEVEGLEAKAELVGWRVPAEPPVRQLRVVSAAEAGASLGSVVVRAAGEQEVWQGRAAVRAETGQAE